MSRRHYFNNYVQSGYLDNERKFSDFKFSDTGFTHAPRLSSVFPTSKEKTPSCAPILHIIKSQRYLFSYSPSSSVKCVCVWATVESIG